MPEPKHPLFGGSKPAQDKPKSKPAAKAKPKTAKKSASAAGTRKKSASAAGTRKKSAASGGSKRTASTTSRKTSSGGRPPAGKPRRRKKTPVGDGPPPGMVRVQKVLAEAGVASRRACEELVLEGRVRVNRKVVATLPFFVEIDKDLVTVDGKNIRKNDAKKVYILVNKPKGVVSTNSDPAGRPRVVDMVKGVDARLFPVGRLDIDSTGLILLTNDGELANRLTHPRYGVEKTYVVEVDGRMTGDALEKLKSGMYLDGKRTARVSVKVLRRNATRTLLEVRLREGRNREIRRLIARLEYKVRSLRRVAIGGVTDRGVKTGNHRTLKAAEVRALEGGSAAKPKRPAVKGARKT